ncbi:hypothetical protein CYMTET_25636 [Cymbomonas tetramitiformis]|uniref:Uncharacterized protein n=1 Tax=Cymbomonas tetramitiformis TaxID=36881 RepID=A0AAE0KYZ5_9CHLO|nr:hypothetical protein CYMTET_25636 [Cymbomonas tetramitiformis]
MVLDSTGLRSKAKRALSALRNAARAGARLKEREATVCRRDPRRNQAGGSAADRLMTGEEEADKGSDERGRHRTEGVFSDTRGREAWLRSIQVETRSHYTTNLATVLLHQTKLADALNGITFEQSDQYNTQMRNTVEKGDSHDPTFFGEGGDDAPVAGVEPKEAREAHGGREEPELQTQAGVEPGIFGHTPEDPRVGTKRVRLRGPARGPEGRKEDESSPTNSCHCKVPRATMGEEENGPRTSLPERGATPWETTQEVIGTHSPAEIRLDDGRGTAWTGSAAQVVSLREWVLAQVAKGDVRTGDLFRVAVTSGFPRDAIRLMTTHLVSGEKVVWVTHHPVNDNQDIGKWWRIDTMELSVGTGPVDARDPEEPAEGDTAPQTVEATARTTILAKAAKKLAADLKSEDDDTVAAAEIELNIHKEIVSGDVDAEEGEEGKSEKILELFHSMAGK